MRRYYCSRNVYEVSVYSLIAVDSYERILESNNNNMRTIIIKEE